MDIAFPRVESILNRLRDVVKCQTCLTLKEEDLMVFFHACDHFYCLDCIGKSVKCPLCENILDKPIKILNDKNILSLYQSLVRFQLPSKDDVEKIYNNHIESKKQILKTIPVGSDPSCENEEPVEESPKNSNESKASNLNQNTSEVKGVEINSNSTLVEDVKINSNSTLINDDEKNSSSVILSSDDVSPVETPKVNKRAGRLKKNENVTPLTIVTRGKRIIISGLKTPGRRRRKNLTLDSTPNVTEQNTNLDSTPVATKQNINLDSTPIVTKQYTNLGSTPIVTKQYTNLGSTPIVTKQNTNLGSTPIVTKQNTNLGSTPIVTKQYTNLGSTPIVTKQNTNLGSTPIVTKQYTNLGSTPIVTKQYTNLGSTPIVTKQNTNLGSTPIVTKQNTNLGSTLIVTKQNTNLDITPAGSSKGNSSCSKLNINKRNAKGETQLHIACKKSNFSLMSELLAAGANPNAQDNAGWTPLHDSVFSGKIDVIKFLLDNGAKVNVRGLENTTALHEAIATGNIAVVKLLLEYGADIEAMNIFRQTPLDLVTKHNLTDFKDLLLKAGKNSKMNVESYGTEDLVQNLVIYKHNLTIEDEKLVNKFADKFDATFTPSLTSKTCPSHIVVPTDNVNITWGFITSVFSGCWVVTIDWVKDSLKDDSLKPASSYEPSKISVSGFTKSRTNKLNNLPGLFSGCHFFLGGNFEFYNIKNLTFGKEDIKALIVQNGGSCLKRCPDPESLALEKSVPFHADPSSSIQGTSYFIIYQSDKWDPELKYNMSHMKSLPIDWLVTCIFKFELVDPINKDVPYCDFL